MVPLEIRIFAISTLAAGIIRARGSTMPGDILLAVQEAAWALFPDEHEHSQDFNEWKKNAGGVPTAKV